MSDPSGGSVIISDISSVYYPVTNSFILSFTPTYLNPGYTWSMKSFWSAFNTTFSLSFQDLSGNPISSFPLIVNETNTLTYKYTKPYPIDGSQPPYSGIFYYFLMPYYVNNNTPYNIGDLTHTSEWGYGSIYGTYPNLNPPEILQILTPNNSFTVTVPYINDLSKPFTSGLPPNIQIYNLIGTYDNNRKLFTISGLLTSNPNSNCIISMTIYNKSYSGASTGYKLIYVAGGQYPPGGPPLIIQSGEVFNYSFKFTINNDSYPWAFNPLLPKDPNSGDTYVFSFSIQINNQTFYAIRPWTGNTSSGNPIYNEPANTAYDYPNISSVYVRIP